MEGRAHSGVVVVMNSCGDPRRAAEWDTWYTETFFPASRQLPQFDTGLLFTCDKPYKLHGQNTHVAIYETSRPMTADDIAQITAAFEAHGDHPPSGRAHVLSYTKLTAFGDLGPRRLNSVLFILCDALYPDHEPQFNEWYEHHGPYALSNTTNYVGTRYVADDPRPLQGKFLTIYESEDLEPGERHREALEWWEEHQSPEALLDVPLKLWCEDPLLRRV